MLATLTDKPFSKSEWIFELKLDGYRVIAARQGKRRQTFIPATGNSFTERYHLIAEELSELNAALSLTGKSVIWIRQKKRISKNCSIMIMNRKGCHYYVFDILWLNGHDLKNLPLTERKKLLQALLSKSPPHIHYLDHVDKEGHVFFEKIEKDGLEGSLQKNPPAGISLPNDRKNG
jgi:bifunctional non-homologous end joining protein LigD